MSPRTGRPPSQNPMSERLHIRITPKEKEEVMNFSQESGVSLLELIKIGIETVKKRNNV